MQESDARRRLDGATEVVHAAWTTGAEDGRCKSYLVTNQHNASYAAYVAGRAGGDVAAS